MPLGLDTPSTIGIATAVLGPVYLETKDAVLTWQVGMATLMIIGIFKIVLSFFGDWVRRHIPQAGLLGSLAGLGITLLAFFPVMKIFSAPVAGLVSLGIILYSLTAARRLPFRHPGSLPRGSRRLPDLLSGGRISAFSAPTPRRRSLEFHPAFPVPTLGFIFGLGKAMSYLPIAFPFALLTIIGGINNTESARVAGDEYRTRDILLTEAVATVVAALFGGVAQSTPYIGHPAYKAMGGRAAYTLATGLFIGIGGALGAMSIVVEAIPEAVITPILLFVGIEIVSQAFIESPRKHIPAVTFSIMPVVAYLVLTYADSLVGKLDPATILPKALTDDQNILRATGHGFILTAILWGGFLADLIDGGDPSRRSLHDSLRRTYHVWLYPLGDTRRRRSIFPWQLGNNLVWQIATGYGLIGIVPSFQPKAREAPQGSVSCVISISLTYHQECNNSQSEHPTKRKQATNYTDFAAITGMKLYGPASHAFICVI